MAKFAIMGYGTLGSGLAHVAHVNHDSIMEKVGEEIAVKYILDIRDFENNPYQDLMIKDFSIIENDPEHLLALREIRMRFQNLKKSIPVFFQILYLNVCILEIRKHFKNHFLSIGCAVLG